MESPSTTSPRPTRAYLALILGVIVIGFSPIFVKLAGTTGDVVGAYRMLIGASALTIPAGINWRRGRARMPRRMVGLVVLAGALIALDVGVWNQSLTMTSASSATFIGNTAPVWVALGAWLIFHERLKPAYWLGLAAALGGAALLVGLDAFEVGRQAALGNLMAAGGGVAYAGFQLLSSRIRSEVDTLSYNWLFSLVSGVLFLIAVGALGHPLIGLSLRSYLALLAAGLINHALGWLLINYSFGHLPAPLVSVTLLGQPIIATLLAAPILGEVPTVWHVVGGLVTVGGIAIVHRSMSG